MRKILIMLTTAMLAVLLACPAFAADDSDEMDTAAAYLRERGIMVGDQNGEMHLEQGLTRAELAAILTRFAGNLSHVQVEQGYYSRQCKFNGVPEWAKVYVGFCSTNGLMMGYGGGLFGATDQVTPAAACTVILRYLEQPETDWSYSTACQRAVEQKLIPSEAVVGSSITRGNMAILIYRALGNMVYADSEEANVPETPIGGSADAPYAPEVGDVIHCSDGTDYNITDVSRWDANAFAAGPLGALPEATCDWEQLYQPEMPEAEAKHYSIDGREYLFMRNLYETRWMLYTLYNAMGDIPELWNGVKAVTRADGTPKVHIQLTVPEDISAYPFWPWKDDQIRDSIAACPAGTVYMEAWDVYKDGVFQRTEYSIRIK